MNAPIKAIPLLVEYFKDIEAPRLERNKRHRLLDVIALKGCITTIGAMGYQYEVANQMSIMDVSRRSSTG